MRKLKNLKESSPVSLQWLWKYYRAGKKNDIVHWFYDEFPTLHKSKFLEFLLIELNIHIKN